jgi:hypothetical protein
MFNRQRIITNLKEHLLDGSFLILAAAFAVVVAGV